MRTRAQIVERARTHVGHREVGENDSVLIRAWLRRCGVVTPAPWCAAFASWCIEEYWDVDESAPEFVKQAGALKLAALFPETRDPQPGDLMFFPTGGGFGHCGIVVAALPDRVLCIEGNSDNRVRYVWRLRSEVRFASTRDEAWDGSTWTVPSGVPLVHVQRKGTR
jgi:hypothetical protein